MLRNSNIGSEIPTNEEVQQILKEQMIGEADEEVVESDNRLSVNNTKTKLWVSSKVLDSMIDIFQIEFDKGNKFILPVLKALRNTKTTLVDKLKQL